jgi:sugar phosphate isomerase/epimerase
MKTSDTRRRFLQTAGLSLAAGSCFKANEVFAQGARPAAAASSPMLGVASYSLRKFKVEDALAMTLRLGISRMVFKDFHLPLNASDEEIRRVMALATSKGVEVYGCGTVYMKNEGEVDQAFRYAKTAGMKLIVGAPNIPLLPYVEKKVKETGVILAIHNHGPDNPLYASPLEAYDLVKGMDKRMGLCVDIGHTQRLGQDPLAVFQKVFERTYDVHIKDVNGSNKAAKTLEIGRGVIDIAGFLRLVLKLKYTHTLSFEYEKDPDDPFAGLAESVGYVRGMLKLLSA